MHHKLAVVVLAVLGTACAEQPSTTSSSAALETVTYFRCDDSGCTQTRGPDPDAPFVAACDSRECEVTGETGRAVLRHDVARFAALDTIAEWRKASAQDNTYPWGGAPAPYLFDATCVWLNQLDLTPSHTDSCPDTGHIGDPPTCGTGGPCPPEPPCHINHAKCTMCTVSFTVEWARCALKGPLAFFPCVVQAGFEYADCVEDKCECP